MSSGPIRVALESAVFTHGLPAERVREAAQRMRQAVERAGAQPAVVGVLEGRAVVGLSDAELDALVERPDRVKINAANLTLAQGLGWSGGTTVAATLELASRAGVRVMATGGVGGLHRGWPAALDVSGDLLTLSRTPMAVVCSGVKCTLDVQATRAALEALGVAVVGWRTDEAPAFYLAEGGGAVDARFDDMAELARFVRFSLARRQAAVLVVNPLPAELAIAPEAWRRWLDEASASLGGAAGPQRTPAELAALAEVSGGATVEANLALLERNAALAGELAAALAAV